MPGLYHNSARPSVAQHLAGHDRSMQSLLNQLPAHPESLPPDWVDRWQISTPDDLRRHLTED